MNQVNKRKNNVAKDHTQEASAQSFSEVSKPRVKTGATGAKTKPRPTAKHGISKNKRVVGRSDDLGKASALWTKEAPKMATQNSFLGRILRALGKILLFIIKGLFYGLRAIFGGIVLLVKRSKIALAVVLILIVLLAGTLIDLGVNWGKIYAGVKVGELDLSGKTAEEAQTMLEETYNPRLSSKTIFIFAHEEAEQNLFASLVQPSDAASSEQAFVDAQTEKLVWKTDAFTLAATLDSKALVADALACGRENGGLFTRLHAFFSGYVLAPRAHYGEEALGILLADIDATIGNPRVNYSIAVVEGRAVVVEGHEGDMVNQDTFTSELDRLFFANNDSAVSCVAQTEHAPLQIGWEQAQLTCDRVNTAISFGAQFIYQNASWTVNATDLGNWVQTRIEQQGESWSLVPYLDYERAKEDTIRYLKVGFEGNIARVRFTIENGQAFIHSESAGTIPKSYEAIDRLNQVIFESEQAPVEQPVIQVTSTSISRMTLQEALDCGVVSHIAEYTTEYTASVANRNHNIHLVADLLNQSIVSADGGVWSFHETAGNCNEEAGFRGAGSILDGEYVDEIGGGICQVATTVFNAVYDAGYPIVRRHNHTLYIASYPAGRDAAVSWPDLDLQWMNDTTSDILVLTSYTETSITVALYGVSPGYVVSTQEGEWVEGEKFKTKVINDDTLDPGDSYVKTPGVNASKITVVRTVKDKFGTILREDTFTSSYDPKDEVKVEGPKTEEEQKAETENPPASVTEEGETP